MSFMDEYKKQKKKQQEQEEKKKQSPTNSFLSNYKKLKNEQAADEDIAPTVMLRPGAHDQATMLFRSNDIAPTGGTVRSGSWDVGADTSEKRTWFEGGAFRDGYQFGDVIKTLLGTAVEANDNLGTAVVDATENLIDTGAHVAGTVGGWFSDDFREDTRKFIAKDLLHSEESGKVVGDIGSAGISALARLISGDTEENSLLGEKSEGLVQSAAHLVGSAALQYVGVPMWVTMGVNSFGSEIESAYQNDATWGEGTTSAAITTAVELLTEKISGGINFGGGTLDDVVVKPLLEKISDKAVRTAAKLGVDVAGEGFEEILAGLGSAIGQKLTYADEKELGELFSFEDAWESFIGGAVLGGVGSSIQAINASKRGVDYVTGLTANEEAVVNKEVERRIAEQEKDGKKLTTTQKNAIKQQVEEDMAKGRISTDTIEEVLSGDAYKAYQDNSSKLDALQAEYNELYNMKTGDKSDAQIEHQAQLKQQLEELKQTFDRDTAKAKLNDEVFEMVKGDRLAESYNELARKHTAYTADLSKYDKKQQAVIQKAIDSGILNNTNRTHEFVDMIAKISADKGVLFDFTNNQRLKESGFAMDGVVRNGFVSKDGVTLNVQSAKALNKVVGHEITHVLEGTDFYKELQSAVTEYARSKGEYDSRLKAITELYSKHDPDADPVKELTADLVGDYLFTDTEFINNLSTNHRNVFQKMYDEVKYLCKVATAGSKEARQLEKVKKAFAEAYKADSKAKTEKQYSLGEIVDGNNKSYGVGVHLDSTLLDNLTPAERLGMVKEYVKELGGESFTAYDPNGNAVDITIAKPNARFKNQSGKKTLVNKDLTTKYIGNEAKQEAIALIDELIVAAEYDGSKAPRYPHGWLDNNGQNNWEYWTTYIEDKNNTIWEATLNIANTANGEKILYDISPIKKVGQSVKSDTIPTTDNIAQENPVVKRQFSLSDSTGKQLTKEQNEYFKDSKIRDENGNLLKVYHTTNSDFTVFDKSKQGEATGDSNTYMGFFFSDDAEYLQNFPQFQNGKTEPYYLNVKNPIDMTDISKDAFLDIVEVLGGDVDSAADIYEEVKLENGNGPVHLIHMLQETGADATYADLIEELKPHYSELMAKGYDGVINYLSEYRGVKEYIVLDSNQAKLTSNTNPTADPDIRFSLSEDSHGREIPVETQERLQYSVIRDEGGRIKPMYHGSPNGNITSFNAGTYFTENQEYADRYQNTSASSISAGKVAVNPKTYEVYLDIRKPFDLADAEARRIYIEDYIKGGNAIGINPYLSDAEYAKITGIDWTEGEDLKDFLIDNGYDYDGIVLDEGADGGYGEDVKYRGKSYVIFSPEQVVRTDLNSLSNVGETQKSTGNYNVYGKDIALPSALEIAPVAQAETAETEQNVPIAEDVPVNVENSTTTEELFPDNLVSIEQEIDSLTQQLDEVESRLSKMVEDGQFGDEFNRLSEEWSNVKSRLEALEQEANAEDTDRLSSLDDVDAPPEVTTEYDEIPDTTPLSKDAVNWITDGVNGQLPISRNQMADVRNLIQEYSTNEYTREQLYYKVREKFGTYTNTYVSEDVKNAKAMLRNGSAIDISNALELTKDAVLTKLTNGELRRMYFGKVRFSKNGVPVDVVYQELNGICPGYFPESIINPGDQLAQILKVADMDAKVTETHRVEDSVLWDVTDSIIDGVNDYRQIQREQAANEAPTKEYLDSLLGDIAPTAVAEKNTATQPVEPVEPVATYEVRNKKGVADGQQAFMPDAGVTEPLTRKALHQGIMDSMKTKFAEKGLDFDKVLKKAKNLSTFSTVDNTPQRVMEKALGYKEGQILSDITVNKVAQNETEGIKWLNSITNRKDGLLAQLSKQYNIKPGSKESAAAQMYAEGFYVTENNDIVSYGDAELATDFKDPAVRSRIKGLAKDPRIRQFYDETLASINESRTRNAYPEIPRLDNYFLHFRAMEDTFSRLGLPFNPNDIRAKDLPTDLNGVTADLKPGQPYFASAMHRTGKRTSFDLLGGLERYATAAKNQIYHIDDIQTLRALRNYIADTYGQANGLEGLDALSEEEAQERIEKVYKSHLSTFAKFLNEEANVLAGKTTLIDRGVEGIIGRRAITFLDTINKQVGSNMVGFNVSSSLTNFLPVAQTFAKTNKADFVKAFGQTVANKVSSIYGRSDDFAENSPVVIRRKGADRFSRTPFQKVGDAGYVLMSAVDDISTELIARTKYNELTRKGMDSQQAHYETDKWVSRLMGDRSLGQQPQLYNSKTLGLITKFQLEVRNQLDSQFYDTIQEVKVSNEDIQNGLLRNAKTAAKVTATFVQLAVVQHLFGKAFESIAGYNPAFDIIDVIVKTFGWDDDEDEEDTVLDNVVEGFLALIEDLPYTSTLTGGRIPISSALPIEELVTGTDQYGNEKSRLETVGEVAPYYLLPGGYGQIKKTVQGLDMFLGDHPIAGSYTDSGDLRFPVDATVGNVIQAGVFGQYASKNAREYFERGRSPLNEKQIQEFMDVGMTIQDYWNYRDGLSGLKTLAEKADYIDSLNLTNEQKNVLINNIADRKEDIDMSEYGKYDDFEEFDFATKNPEKYDFLQKNGISYSDYASADDKAKDAYNWAYKNPEKYTLSQAVTSDVVTYRQYTVDIYDLEADKDENGNSISGSRKEKVFDYINNLDLDYGQKIILYRSMYDSKADQEAYNADIVEYLNSRHDISYREMETILTELGFVVDEQGNIYW